MRQTNDEGLADGGESLFISDLHLGVDRPEILACFLRFLEGRARAAQRLYILGDLFDVWIGDDDLNPFNQRVIQALRDLTLSGTACALLRGNRDFLLGRRFARLTGCVLLSDPHRVLIGGESTLLMHGDLLCTQDLDYQRLRRRLRNPVVQWLFLHRPLAKRQATADAYRQLSASAIAEKPLTIMDVEQKTVERYLRRHRAQRLIHGHTHRPEDHVFSLEGRPVERLVLAEWRDGVGEVLSHSAHGWQREVVR
ncbi:UDP-2,3-diacylglucosamine diphosphatase [Caldichromatium japonicum]|uniref:UDP-2,3-diacylglucosamine hydrolase n=1 Tax=Caldichromatium japonicum TaxID=2699430 RepID=A0A6G7VGI7_9GAMM|nr:UDP-2,3-diacylglucosamine diphosphatase [Caldichromatium japonicum]